jgi:hypothetical protein
VTQLKQCFEEFAGPGLFIFGVGCKTAAAVLGSIGFRRGRNNARFSFPARCQDPAGARWDLPLTVGIFEGKT